MGLADAPDPDDVALPEDKDDNVVRAVVVLVDAELDRVELEDGVMVELDPVGLSVLKIDAGSVVLPELPLDDATAMFDVGELFAPEDPEDEDELVIVNVGEMFPESPSTITQSMSER